MQEVLVLVIVIAAAAYVFRSFYTGAKKGGACECGCDACDTAADCTDPSRGMI